MEYKDLFYSGISLFILPIVIYIIDNYRGLRTNRYSTFIVGLLTLFCICFFVNRPILVATDTEVYIAKMHIYKSNILFGKDFIQSKDIAWDYFSYLCAYLDFSDREFLLACSILFIGPLIFAYRKLFKNDMLLPYYLLISCFFFYSLGTNVLRSGIGFSFFMLGLVYRDRLKLSVLFFATAILFHLSFILPIVLWLLFRFFKIDIKYVVALWLLMLLIAFLNISALNNILTVIDSTSIQTRISSYTNNTDLSYKTGFKLNFVLFSLFFGTIGVFFSKKIFTNDFYNQILKIYIATNAFFLLTMNIPFSDRFALLSWCLIPIICSYPLIESNYNKWRGIIFCFSAFLLLFNFIIF